MNDLVKLYLRVAHVDVDDIKKWNTLRRLLEKKDYAKAVLYLLRHCKLSAQDMMHENYTDYISGDEFYTSHNGRYVITFSDIMIDSVSLYERAPRLYK